MNPLNLSPLFRPTLIIKKYIYVFRLCVAAKYTPTNTTFVHCIFVLFGHCMSHFVLFGHVSNKDKNPKYFAFGLQRNARYFSNVIYIFLLPHAAKYMGNRQVSKALTKKKTYLEYTLQRNYMGKERNQQESG